MAMPLWMIANIRILMSCRPNFQHVRSRARSHGPDPTPAILTITRASWLPSKMTCSKKRGCVAGIRGAGALTPAPSRLGDADIVRASEFQHAVEDMDRHVHLGGPTLIGVRAQPVPDHALEPADGGLGPGARIVARGLLPA